MKNFIKVAALAAVTLSSISVFAQRTDAEFNNVKVDNKIEVYDLDYTMYKGDYATLTKTSLAFGSSVPTSTSGTTIKRGEISIHGANYGATKLTPTSLTIGNYYNNSYLYTGSYLNLKCGTKTIARFSTSSLQLDGKIYCEALEVKQVNLADYVFAENYQLKSLKEVESFIAENKHLPNVPSAKTVAEEGMNVGEFQNILLEKVEELTLYIIEQQKKIEALEAKIQ